MLRSAISAFTRLRRAISAFTRVFDALWACGVVRC